jgi:hypothetical protein
VAGKAGDTIETTTKNTTVQFITISDLAHPLLQFSVDEMDMNMVAKGEAAQVIFDAFPNRTFKGSVTRVDPALSTSDGASSVSGLIQLDLSQETDVPIFPKNLSGSVLIIQPKDSTSWMAKMSVDIPGKNWRLSAARNSASFFNPSTCWRGPQPWTMS